MIVYPPALISKRVFYRSTVFFAFLLSLISSASAQQAYSNNSFDGYTLTVFDEQLKETLIGVYVVSEPSGFSAVTDHNGQVKLVGIADQDTLIFNYMGYQEKRHSFVDIRSNGGKVYLAPNVTSLGEVVVLGPSKTPERSREVPSRVEVIDAKETALVNPSTTAELLEKSGSVFVQKSQMGGGSPIIRGFEANKVLIVLDGVRLNNAIYRNGHLQNVITIDHDVLDHAEIVFGPSSVIYGSDALGGVMHLYTKTPKLRTEDDPVTVNARLKYATANIERSGHVNFSLGNDQWASLTAISYSNFSNLRTGANRRDAYPDFGKRLFYQDRINEVDTVLANPDPNIQIGTEYSQIDVLQKVRWVPKDNLEFIANVQYSTSSDVPRYDQLQQGRFVMDSGRAVSQDFRFAEWNYGPQQRLFGSLSANVRGTNKFFNNAKVILAYQNIDEDRITRRFGNEWQTHQEENVDVFSVNADFRKNVKGRHKLLYGIEYNHNRVISLAFQRDIQTLEQDDRVQTRYPDGGSNMISMAGYLSYQTKLGKKKKFNLIGGLRYSYITLTSSFVDTSFFSLPDIDITLNTRALTGSLGLTWDVGAGFDIHTVLSSAFRAPNVDDFGKVRSKNGYVTLPNPNLVAEKSYNADLTITKRLGNKVKLTGSAFYTYLFDAIVRQNCTEGDDMNTLFSDDCLFYYDGAFDTIQYNTNAGEAFIYGISGDVLVEILPELTLRSGINFTYGQNIMRDQPLPHIPPIYGQTTLNYQPVAKVNLRFTANYNGWKRADRFAPDGSSDNLDLATPDGSPSWYTLNFYSTFDFTPLQLSVGIENILDQHYRLFSSGVSAPGRNLIISLRGNF